MAVSFQEMPTTFSRVGSQETDALGPSVSRLKVGSSKSKMSQRALSLTRSRSSYTQKWNRDLTAALTQLTNEKLPTDIDRAATGTQPYKLGAVNSSRAFKLPSSPHDLQSILVALFGVLIKR